MDTCVQPNPGGLVLEGKSEALDGGVEGEGHHHEHRPNKVRAIRNTSSGNVSSMKHIACTSQIHSISVSMFVDVLV